MFQGWCNEYDDLVEGQERLDAMIRTFGDNEAKPVLPAEEVANLKAQFRSLDISGVGALDIADVALALDLPRDMLNRYDLYSSNLGGDGCIDEHEFLMMMCPTEYRLPATDNFGRDVFGRLLSHESNIRRKSLTKFIDNDDKNPDMERLSSRMERPHAMLPVVDREVWLEWNTLFDALDKDGDGVVWAADLPASGMLDLSECEFVVSWIDNDNKQGFSREAFLSTLLRAHGCRRPYDRMPETF
eukprot:gnl/TRDRNA2_/TRDRNA2_59793_c0_seq1.p1 gnl/TRDRNA2_/TRDRNA2_59793_c0~~gnl/TRDRNA2_/TRDRNA2_59793_c0_seq1.p1  ORF type:complete len:243 (+),score=41.00 gnl/TRDRNA2_/TRDRNA2_59793_c0_seq1:188-916(+)